MAQAKRITQLDEKPTIVDNDEFVISDSQDLNQLTQTKKVKAITIKNYVGGGGSSGDMLKSVYDTNNNGIVDDSEKLGGQLPSFYLNRSNHTGTQSIQTISDAVLFWDLSQFQSNAGLVIPLGQRVYYKRSDGKLTGIYKVGDGVNQLSNLPVFYDDWEVLPNKRALECSYAFYQSYNYVDIANKIKLASNTFGNTNSANSTETPAMRGNLIFIPFPVKLYGLGSIVNLFSSIGSLSYALYRVNDDYTATKVAEIINSNNVTATGNYMYNLATPVDLEPGVYGIYYIKVGGQFAATRANSTQNQIYLLRNDFAKHDYYFAGASTFPSTLTFPLSSFSPTMIKYEFFIKFAITI
ncbi:MAG: hypothetical protein QXF76_02755 [Candidatus Anstonellales archaeon]